MGRKLRNKTGAGLVGPGLHPFSVKIALWTKLQKSEKVRPRDLGTRQEIEEVRRLDYEKYLDHVNEANWILKLCSQVIVHRLQGPSLQTVPGPVTNKDSRVPGQPLSYQLWLMGTLFYFRNSDPIIEIPKDIPKIDVYRFYRDAIAEVPSAVDRVIEMLCKMEPIVYWAPDTNESEGPGSAYWSDSGVKYRIIMRGLSENPTGLTTFLYHWSKLLQAKRQQDNETIRELESKIQALEDELQSERSAIRRLKRDADDCRILNDADAYPKVKSFPKQSRLQGSSDS